MKFDFKILLASGSPRRQELLRSLGLQFEAQSTAVDETYPHHLEPENVPEYLAQKKAEAVTGTGHDTVVISADTVVILKGKILEKPGSKAEAKRFLQQLSGKPHEVITGVCIKYQKAIKLFKETTIVTFGELQEDEINYYVDTFNPLDKAGAYGIQEWIGMIGVTRLEGSYFNVVGLPVHRLYQELKRL